MLGRRASLPELRAAESSSTADVPRRCRDGRGRRGIVAPGRVPTSRALEQAPRGTRQRDPRCLRLTTWRARTLLVPKRDEARPVCRRCSGGRPDRAVLRRHPVRRRRAPRVAVPRAGAAGATPPAPGARAAAPAPPGWPPPAPACPAPRPLHSTEPRAPVVPRRARRRGPRAHPGAVPRDGRGAPRARPPRRLRGPRAAPPRDRSTGLAATPSARSPSGGAPRPGEAPRVAARTPPARRRGRPS